jgi:hypothetical protein
MQKNLVKFFLIFTLFNISCNHASNSSTKPDGAPNPKSQNSKPYFEIAEDARAEALSEYIKEFHSPFGLAFLTFYTAGDSQEIMRWEGFGDSALWTGVHLAAESFRYKVTGKPEALADALRVLEAIRKLSLLNRNGLLARYFYPTNGPFVDQFLSYHQQELQSVIDGQEYYYMTNTSRDQYAGIFFGLGVAYDMLDDQNAKNTIRDVVTRLVDYLLKNNWSTLRPNGEIRTVFIQMPQQILSILNLARHVNPEKFRKEYETARFWRANNTTFPIWVQTWDEVGSYYKFNLEHLYIYNLIRLEEPGSRYLKYYNNAYDALNKVTKNHMNAHFNMVDRALRGPNFARDQNTRTMLDQLINRPRGFRFVTVDVRGKYPACGNRACNPVPVSERTLTDFMWQTPPWDLFWQGDDRIESSGVDYLLPYWMGRYYGVYD